MKIKGSKVLRLLPFSFDCGNLLIKIKASFYAFLIVYNERQKMVL